MTPSLEQATSTVGSTPHASPTPSAGAGLALCCLVIAAVLLGYTLQISHGFYAPIVLQFLTAALLAALFAVTLPAVPSLEARARRAVPVILGAGLLFQFGELISGIPMPHGHMRIIPTENDFYYLSDDMDRFYAATAAAAMLAGGLFAAKPWLGRLHFPALLVTHLIIGAWVIHFTPTPGSDTRLFTNAAAENLLHGKNPYTARITDLHDPHFNDIPALNAPARELPFGHPSPPVNLLLTLPGHLLGDYRYASLLLLEGAVALVAYARNNRLAFPAGALFLFTPQIFTLVEEGWSESSSIFLLALTLFAACRLPRLRWFALGLFIASKTSFLLAIPLGLLLLPPKATPRQLATAAWQAAIPYALVNLPFLLWNPAEFINALGPHDYFRAATLSYAAGWMHLGNVSPPAWVGYLVALLAVIGLLWRHPRTPAAFSAAVGVLFLIFPPFHGRAFLNDYLFALAALCFAVACEYPLPAASPETPSPALTPNISKTPVYTPSPA